MSISAATLRTLMAAGVTGEALLAVADAIEADMAAAIPAVKPRSAGAERQARHRTKLQGKVTQSDVTSDIDSDVTEPSLEKSPPPKSNNLNPPQTSLRSDTVPARGALVAEFRAAYPKRQGSNPWQPAEEKMLRLLKASSDPEKLGREIIDGTKAYAASREGQDPVFTMQAKRFINEGGWKDHHAKPAHPPPKRGRYDGPSMAELAGVNSTSDLLSSLPDEPRDRSSTEPRPNPSDQSVRGFAGRISQPDGEHAVGQILNLQRVGAYSR